MEMPEDKIRKVLKIAKEPISMETPIGEDEDASIGDLIEDTTIALPVMRQPSTTSPNQPAAYWAALLLEKPRYCACALVST